MTTLHGVVTFHSETGTEGGYWAFQDEKFMNLPSTSAYWRCTQCGRVWDKSRDSVAPKPNFSYRRPVLYRLEGNTWMPHRVPDDATKLPVPSGEGERIQWYSFGYDKPMTFPITPEGNDDYQEAINAISLVCYENGHERWESPEEQHPDGMWSYEGLHIPKNGDHLTIYDKVGPTKVVWDGEIDLTDVPLFTEDAFGMWIHNDQKGIDREKWARWFLDENPADYTPKDVAP